MGRVLPHAVITTIFLNKGLTESQVSFVQSFYMLSMLVSGFPIGMLCDIFSEKNIYQFALVSIFLSFYIMLTSNNIFLLCLSRILYGVAQISIISSLNLYFPKNLKLKNKPIKPFYVEIGYVNMFSALIGGTIGSIIFKYINIKIYLLSLILFFFSYVMIFIGMRRFIKIDLNIKKKDKEKAKLNYFIKVLKVILKDRKIVLMISQLIFFQLSLEIFYRYWELLFRHKNISVEYFGITYGSMQLLSILINNLFSINKFKIRDFLLFTPITLFFILFVKTRNLFLSLVFFFLMASVFYFYNRQLELKIQVISNPLFMSSIISFSTAMSNIASFVLMQTNSMLLKSNISIETITCSIMLVFFFGSVLTNFLDFIIKKKKRISIN
jgi:MFS family permease